MTHLRLAVLSAIAMVAFAANSLLCRIALTHTAIDAASFTTIRLLSGAITLYAIARALRGKRSVGGNWLSALALLGYAAGFSFAYRELSAATGALLLFGAVQCSMIGYGLFAGERLSLKQACSVAIAASGLLWLLLPGASAPEPQAAVLMLAAGACWGIYSLRGKRVVDATWETAGNFVRATPFALALSLAFCGKASLDASGALLAIASGALASGLGYALWYATLPAHSATSAATVQLSVPALAAAAGALLLGEPLSSRTVFASLAILGGIAFYLASPKRSKDRLGR